MDEHKEENDDETNQTKNEIKILNNKIKWEMKMRKERKEKEKTKRIITNEKYKEKHFRF